jgi:UDP-N-acetylmuramate dehydrogenase
MAAERTQSSHGVLRYDEPMSRHTSWRVGGPADIYFIPASRDDLSAFLRELAPDTPVHWVGLGSNLLVRDGGIRGAVVAVSRALSEIRNLGDGVVEAGAGAACTVLARQCVRWELGPAEFFAGIPGTVGGALKMNAGAFGGETWDCVAGVDVVNRRGDIYSRVPDAYSAAYREVSGPAEEWFLAARFRFEEAYDTSMAKVRALIQERREKQPLGLPSCGSVFRNPPGDHAARLIETAGLKGFRIGGAEVSPKHANFIINSDNATAADVEAVIEHVHGVVQQVHGVSLVREVHIVGEQETARGGGL